MASKRHHLVIDIPKELHTEIKVIATRRHMTLKSWVIVALMERIRKEQETY